MSGKTRTFIQRGAPPFLLSTIFSLVLITGFQIDDCHSGLNQWIPMGPEGGNVSALAIPPGNPNVLYAGTYGSGVFKTMDGGANWNVTGLIDVAVNTLAIDPGAPDTVYAGTGIYSWTRAGVYKSTDGGDTWVETGLKDLVVNVIAIDPTSPNVVYAGTSNGIWKSGDGGVSWTLMDDGLAETDIKSLAIDPIHPETLYAGTEAGVFKSEDGATHWSPKNSGLTNTYVNTLVIHPGNPDILYAGTKGGVFKTINGGDTWSITSDNPLITMINTLAIDPLSPETLYAGSVLVFKSTDGGATWNMTSLPASYVGVILLDPVNPSVLYAGTWDGVFRSSDAAESWTSMNSGLKAMKIYALAVNSGDSNTILAATWNALLKTNDAGESWNVILKTQSNLETIAINQQATDTIYVGSLLNIYEGWKTFRVLKSTDGGATWKNADAGITDTGVLTLTIDPQSPGTLYAGTTSSVFKSQDGGNTWEKKGSGLPARRVNCLAISPANPAILYAGTGDGVFKSTNGAMSWTVAGLSDTQIDALVIAPQNPDIIYAVAFDDIYKSTNGGTGWSNITDGLPLDATNWATSLAIDPDSSGTVYAGTQAGVHRTVDSGKSWKKLSYGLTNTQVNAILVDPLDSQTLYASTEAGGVFRIHLQLEPVIVVNPTSLNFGTVLVGNAQVRIATVRNDGTEDLILGPISNPSSPFSKESDDCSGRTLAPVESCTISVRFTPPSEGIFSSSFGIPSNDLKNPLVTVSLDGTGGWPELTPTGLTGPASAVAGSQIEISWTAKNQGSAGVPSIAWYDTIYLSADTAWDENDLLLGSFSKNGPLSPGAIYTQTKTVTLPQVPLGSYYLILRVDSTSSIPESNEVNNERSIPIILTVPDLVPIALSAPASAYSGDQIELSWKVENQGTVEIPSPSSWNDNLYLSADTTLDPGDILMGSFSKSMGMAPGTSYTQTRSVSLPCELAGTYYLILRTDAQNNIAETDETNNDRLTSLVISKPEATPLPMGDSKPFTVIKENPVRFETIVPEGQSDLFVLLQKNSSWDGKLELNLDCHSPLKALRGSTDLALQISGPAPGTYITGISGSGSGTVSILASLRELILGEWTLGTIYRSWGSAWYQLNVPEGQSLLAFSVETLGVLSKLEVFYGTLWSSQRWSATGYRMNLDIPSPAPGMYYIHLTDSAWIQGDDQGRDHMIKADVNPIEPPACTKPVVTCFSPTKGGTAGPVTVTINGQCFDPNVTVCLKREGHDDVCANGVSAAESKKTILATFDLASAEPGEWTLVVTNPDSQLATAQVPFSIETGGEPKLWVEIAGREQIRLGRPQRFIIRYGNNGLIGTEAEILLWLPRAMTIELADRTGVILAKAGKNVTVPEDHPNVMGFQIILSDVAPASQDELYLIVTLANDILNFEINSRITNDFGSVSEGNLALSLPEVVIRQ